MEIKTYSASEQVDPAVDLGVVPPPLPELLTLRQLVETAPAPPPQIIEGVLHQGCKLILGGTSKSNRDGEVGRWATGPGGRRWKDVSTLNLLVARIYYFSGALGRLC